MQNESYDIIIIGSAGGGTIAQALAGSGARYSSSSAAHSCLKRRRTGARLPSGRSVATARPSSGSTGAVNVSSVYALLRRRQYQVLGQRALSPPARRLSGLEHVDGVSPAWPIDYDTLEPYYERAERLYHVHGEDGLDPTEPPHHAVSTETDSARPGDGSDRHAIARAGAPSITAPAWSHQAGRSRGAAFCATRATRFRVACRPRATPTCCVFDRPWGKPTVTLWTGALASRLLTDASGKRVESVEIERGGQIVRVGATIVIASCGAVNSAALLLRSANDAHPNGLANSSGLVGKRYGASGDDDRSDRSATPRRPRFPRRSPSTTTI